MTKEELLEVFDWLETNMNKQKLFYFKLEDNNQIFAYFKKPNYLTNNKKICIFYINVIRKIIELEKGKTND